MTLKEEMVEVKRLYKGIATAEELYVADAFCETLLSTVKIEHFDELVDCASMCRETAKIMIKVGDINEEYNCRNTDGCNCITPCVECKCDSNS